MRVPEGGICATARSLISLVPAFAAIAAPMHAGAATRQGSEFRVNPQTFIEQGQFAKVAMDADGDFVVAWQAQIGQTCCEYGVYFRRFTASAAPVEPPRQVRSSPGQWNAQVDMDEAGNFLVGWTESQGSFVQRFDPHGLPQGPEVALGGAGPVALDGTGGVISTWHSGEHFGVVLARRYGASGDPDGPAFEVSSDPSDLNEIGDLDVNPSGEFIIAWTNLSSRRVWARRFDATRAPLAPDLQMGDDRTAGSPTVAIAMDGSSAVAWNTSFDRVSSDVAFLALDAAGVPAGPVRQANSFRPSHAFLPRALANDRGFVVTWSAGRSVDESTIHAQEFDLAGQPSGGEYRANASTGHYNHPNIGGNARGDFAIVWQRYDIGSPDALYGLRGQRYRPDGRDGAPTVRLSLGSGPLAEGETRTVHAQLSRPAPQPTRLLLHFSGQAQDGRDYAHETSAVVVPAGVVDIDVTPLQAIVDCRTESESIEIQVDPPADGRLAVVPDSAMSVPLLDPAIAIAPVAETLHEGRSRHLYASVSAPMPCPVSVRFSISGSADPVDDFAVRNRLTVIETGATHVLLATIKALDDGKAELPETVTVQLERVGKGARLGERARTITIRD